MGIRVVAVLVVAVIAGFGCARRHCVPDSITSDRHLIDLSAAPDSHAPVGTGTMREVEAEFRKRTAARTPAGARPYHFLALSGGGMYGAFGVGVLSGWTETGTRPPFDVVTGISTGGLIATYAFLGSPYDDRLKANMLGVTRADILRSRTVLAIPFADAVYNSNPLARKIEKEVTPELLSEVAAAHAAGRRLYIGTTNIDTRRLVIWDMGAIASRGTCESAELYRKIILASSSIPGVFPPVRIPVEVNGQRYEELHVDGGVSDEVIFRAFMVADLNRLSGVPGDTAPAGSTLYVVSNGKLYADSKCVRPRLTNMVSASFRSIVYGKTRDELYRIYLNCLETGVGFRLTALPQEFKLESTGGLAISTNDQERLFMEGYQYGMQRKDGWRELPPGTDRSEQAMPRTGTRFATP
ncbi:MAG TPA: patatin-like phospholipase family protein [Urbifossiella sp.]|jgi:predicted acylesterase/phospholipase RssA